MKGCHIYNKQKLLHNYVTLIARPKLLGLKKYRPQIDFYVNLKENVKHGRKKAVINHDRSTKRNETIYRRAKD